MSTPDSAVSINSTIHYAQAQPYHVTLTKNTKGYQWEISIYSESVSDIMLKIDSLDGSLRSRYGGTNE